MNKKLILKILNQRLAIARQLYMKQPDHSYEAAVLEGRIVQLKEIISLIDGLSGGE